MTIDQFEDLWICGLRIGTPQKFADLQYQNEPKNSAKFIKDFSWWIIILILSSPVDAALFKFRKVHKFTKIGFE